MNEVKLTRKAIVDKKVSLCSAPNSNSTINTEIAKIQKLQKRQIYKKTKYEKKKIPESQPNSIR